MKSLIIVLATCKFGFMANDSVTALKMLEQGFRREWMGLFAFIDFPFQIICALFVARWCSGQQPFHAWRWAYLLKLAMCALAPLMVAYYPTFTSQTTIVQYAFGFICVMGTLASSFASTVMFVALGAFFARISDPLIGGTYMTLLNTLSNLGGTWPKVFILYGVDIFTSDGDTWFSDGYYTVSLVVVLIGLGLYYGVFRSTTMQLEKSLSSSYWRVEESSSSMIEQV
eukprot:CAMPEP_0201562954 /NCGR_PEP_ID=MMETSP0173_2-20130828/79615_1 /ASSEMBLY_ACC=CAM_ASM_000268 /TAXON_ID=218659 /ORGANISM="Vexillifera sp., Strain DIVA3 564/2" /LENGTH=226 /DNA_ID=CAMNT_0047977579 /DNA_START=798 /DNA_END=1478 /DNA_ORIENTATION=-